MTKKLPKAATDEPKLVLETPTPTSKTVQFSHVGWCAAGISKQTLTCGRLAANATVMDMMNCSEHWRSGPIW